MPVGMSMGTGVLVGATASLVAFVAMDLVECVTRFMLRRQRGEPRPPLAGAAGDATAADLGAMLNLPLRLPFRHAENAMVAVQSWMDASALDDAIQGSEAPPTEALAQHARDERLHGEVAGALLALTRPVKREDGVDAAVACATRKRDVQAASLDGVVLVSRRRIEPPPPV